MTVNWADVAERLERAYEAGEHAELTRREWNALRAAFKPKARSDLDIGHLGAFAGIPVVVDGPDS